MAPPHHARKRYARGSVRAIGVLAVAGVILMGTGGGALAQPEAKSIACSAIPGYPIETNLPPRDSDGLLVVPIILHMMMADVPSGNPDWPNSPRPVWTPDKVDQQFASERGLVNRIWKRAGIRIAVVRVDACPYSPRYLRPDKKATVTVPVPGEGPEWDQYYHQINHIYNARDQKALNVYLWVKTGTRGASIYYGTSPRQETAAVWTDMMCVLPEDPSTPEIEHTMLPETCARLLAHEIGHALTLPHTCKVGSSPPGHKDFDLTSCTRQDADAAVPLEMKQNLMRPDHNFEHTMLTSEQKAAAHNAVGAYQGL
jgi:hypothetical protein